MFEDSKKSDISSFDWPFFPITVMDEENNLYVCAHALAIQESSGAYEWVLESMGSIEPILHKITKVVIVDVIMMSKALRRAVHLSLA